MTLGCPECRSLETGKHRPGCTWAARHEAQFSDAEKLAEVNREIRMRHSVYPKLIKGGKLSEQDAARQIAIMEEIAQNYADKISYSQHKEQG